MNYTENWCSLWCGHSPGSCPGYNGGWGGESGGHGCVEDEKRSWTSSFDFKWSIERGGSMRRELVAMGPCMHLIGGCIELVANSILV